MKQSRFLIPTSKTEIDTNLTCQSFSFMQKAGMIKQLASGVYTYLPLAKIIIDNINKIIIDELNKIECYEMLMPILQPKEIWEESGRWNKYGAELFRLHDRHERDFCLGPTHEEVITVTIRDYIKSWKALPLAFFQIQDKFRDELRPRFGLMRAREFIMKDAYSFHRDYEDLNNYFNIMEEAYDRIFERCGLKTIKVSADSGAIGGSGSKEYMAISDIGEDTLVYCDNCDYQANLETATANYDVAQSGPIKDLEFIDTPNVSTIAEISAFLDVNPNTTAKYIAYKDENDNKYIVVVQGNYEINETKLLNLLGVDELILLTDEELKENNLIKGYIGAVNLKGDFKIVIDEQIEKLTNHTAGGNEVDKHYINVNYPRDYQADFIGDIKEVKDGDTCINCGTKLNFSKGIEIGHIFKLGDIYAKALNCKFLDENQQEQAMQMGCYGIGVSRLMMAVIEYIATEKRMLWPDELQPFDYHIIVVDVKKEEQNLLADKIYQAMQKQGLKVLLDDRKQRVGSKFADADLIGVKNRIIVGKKASENIVEYLDLSLEDKQELNFDQVMELLNN